MAKRVEILQSDVDREAFVKAVIQAAKDELTVLEGAFDTWSPEIEGWDAAYKAIEDLVDVHIPGGVFKKKGRMTP